MYHSLNGQNIWAQTNLLLFETLFKTASKYVMGDMKVNKT